MRTLLFFWGILSHNFVVEGMVRRESFEISRGNPLYAFSLKPISESVLNENIDSLGRASSGSQGIENFPDASFFVFFPAREK